MVSTFNVKMEIELIIRAKDIEDASVLAFAIIKNIDSYGSINSMSVGYQMF